MHCLAVRFGGAEGSAGRVGGWELCRGKGESWGQQGVVCAESGVGAANALPHGWKGKGHRDVAWREAEGAWEVSEVRVSVVCDFWKSDGEVKVEREQEEVVQHFQSRKSFVF